MRHVTKGERAPDRVADYSVARAKAIAWLGERYLLARPINQRAARDMARYHHAIWADYSSAV